MEEKIVKSKYIYKGKILKVKVERVKLSDGKETEREVVEHSGSVAILPLIDKDKFLLIRQYRKPVDEIVLEIPAGRIEKGETLKVCANRELIEETGYEATNLKKLTSIYPTPGYCNEVIHIFIGSNLKKREIAPEEDEFIETVILNREEAISKIQTGEIKDSKTIVAILLYTNFSS